MIIGINVIVVSYVAHHGFSDFAFWDIGWRWGYVDVPSDVDEYFCTFWDWDGLCVGDVRIRGFEECSSGSICSAISVGVDADAGVIACLRGAIYMIRE